MFELFAPKIMEQKHTIQEREKLSDGSRNYNALTCFALGVWWIKEGREGVAVPIHYIFVQCYS